MKHENCSWAAEARESQEHINRYVFSARKIEEYCSDPLVLDVACGNGFGSLILSHGAKRVIGADLSAENIEFAKKNFAAKNIEYLAGNAASMPFGENAFDAAVSCETIEHLGEDDQVKFLTGLKRCVKPGGIIVISTPDHLVWQSQAMHQHDHIRELTKKELLDLLGRFFSVSGIYGIKKINQKNAYPKKILRSLLVAAKRVDVFGLRYKLIGGGLRKSLDAQTAPWDANIWPLPLGQGETASDLIAVCYNKK